MNCEAPNPQPLSPLRGTRGDTSRCSPHGRATESTRHASPFSPPAGRGAGGEGLGIHLLLLLPLLLFSLPIFASEHLTVDRGAREVRIDAIVQPDAMTRWFGVQGHHAIVWTEGRSARWALFRSLASDHDVRVALDSLGAKAAENLTVETWTERENPSNPEPDKRVEGTRVDVYVEWPGSPRVPLADLIRQEGAASPDLDFRYGGNEAHQATFKSGCIVCLYSCPGGAVGNHSRTIREYEKEGVIYFARPDRLPEEGARVTLILIPREEP